MVLASCVVLGRDAKLVVELGADISKYSRVQEERRVLKRVFDRCECVAKGRCERQVRNVGAKGCDAIPTVLQLLLCCDCCCFFWGLQDGKFFLLLRTNFTYLVPYELKC